MHPLRIFATVFAMIAGLWLLANSIMSLTSAPEVDVLSSSVPNPDEIARPRVPEEAQSLKNPMTASPEMIVEGREIYLGSGNCYVCHGNEAKGDGEAGALLNPKPSDLTDPTFQRVRKDGEIFWAIKNGVPTRGMFSYVPRMITEEQAWKVVVYIRSLRSV